MQLSIQRTMVVVWAPAKERENQARAIKRQPVENSLRAGISYKSLWRSCMYERIYAYTQPQHQRPSQQYFNNNRPWHLSYKYIYRTTRRERRKRLRRAVFSSSALWHAFTKRKEKLRGTSQKRWFIRRTHINQVLEVTLPNRKTSFASPNGRPQPNQKLGASLWLHFAIASVWHFFLACSLFRSITLPICKLKCQYIIQF